MTSDSESFRHRAATLHDDQGDDAEVAGYLALAYAALERRRRAAAAGSDSAVEESPILLQE